MNTSTATLLAGTRTLTATATTIVMALVILLMGFIIGLIVRRLVRQLFLAIKLNTVREQAKHNRVRADVAVSNVMAGIIYLISIYLALSLLGIATFLIIFLISICCIYLVLWLLFGASDFFTNTVSGMHVLHQHRLRTGMAIHSGLIKGHVEHVGIGEIDVRTNEGELIAVPYNYLERNGVKKA